MVAHCITAERSNRIEPKLLLLFLVVALSSSWRFSSSAHFCVRPPARSLSSHSQASKFSTAQANVWTAGGPGGPGVIRVAVDPSNSNVIYLGTTKGLFKSIDAGKNWTPINDGIVG